MKIVKDTKDLNKILENLRIKNTKIGLVPTMGSIHKGHLSLINEAKKLNCFSIVSIFINPTQFNNINDFNEYPQNSLEDIEMLKKINCDALFFPKTKDMYPKGLTKQKTIFEFRNILCDKFRPGHFDGVTTVVNKLFSLIKPNVAFFGEKDFQQLKIVEKIVINNKLPIKIHPCPSIKLKNGMSYSSRYKNFTSNQKNIFNKIANRINFNVYLLTKKIDLNILNILNQEILEIGARNIEYLEVRTEDSLVITNNNKKARLFVAFNIDQIRVIDNFVLY